MSDNVEHPSHYNTGSVETIDAIKSALGDAFLDYCRGNVLKYVWRCRHKGKLIEDLRKAAKYLEWAIAEAESEKPSEPKPLAIPEGWRELEPRETPRASDMYEHEEMWMKRFDDANCEYEWYDVRHIRKIETLEPQPIEIPEGWRELNDGELLSIHDLFELNGEWTACKHDPLGDRYNSRIHKRHIRKIEPTKPDHVEGVWIEEADANASKIEPTEWIPKVGDKVRVNRLGRLSDGKIGVIVECDAGEYTVRIPGHNLTSRNLTADDLELIEAAS